MQGMSMIFRRFSSERLHHIVLSVLTGAGVIVLVSTAGLSSANAAAGDASAKRGDAIFHSHCITCHNKQPGDTSPFGPPNLHGVFKQGLVTPAQAQTIITEGKGGMPSFGKTLTPAEIHDVIAYVKTL
jgi:mono/diheme cytochrome c family protein